MAKTFGLKERTTLWDKIGSAIAAACAETRDVELFLCRCLEGTQADPASVIRFEVYTALLSSLANLPDPVKREFLEYCKQKSYVVLANGKARWEEYKTAYEAVINRGEESDEVRAWEDEQ